MYGQPSNLFYGDQILSSARGVQQGDPLGPLLFCLVTRELSKSLQSPFNCWYLDDATVGGDSDIVLEDLQTVINQCVTLGLELNMSKCEMYIYGGSKKEQVTKKSMVKRIFPKLASLTNADLLLLGVPILEDAFPSILQEKIRQAELITTRLAKLGAHHA
ncbi:hypothetical protein RvY_03846 [Ramazzottius varieornatus]|uniref:Reverse transcriptase domain-containing protein n=1 Tax=Ramazzottius varieornatus TaxID=947166 RepID=A0A1D1UYU8_RAMVA|nr:hypothetical protein RvY_03846 [Ramazzottius varieornatus]